MMTSNSNTDLKYFLLKGYQIQNGKSDKNIGDVLTLTHPRDSVDAKCILMNNSLFEVIEFNPNKSLIADNYLMSNGKLYFSAPVDPIFMVLPNLKKKASDKYLPLKEILKNEIHPDLSRLIDCEELQYLHLIADNKEQSFMYNEVKTMEWLDKKLKLVLEVLEKKIHTASNESLIKEANGIISQYLSTDIYKSFRNHQEKNSLNKRKSSSYLSSNGKRHKLE